MDEPLAQSSNFEAGALPFVMRSSLVPFAPLARKLVRQLLPLVPVVVDEKLPFVIRFGPARAGADGATAAATASSVAMVFFKRSISSLSKIGAPARSAARG